VARPPLYKVTQRKQVRYVQTAEEMNRELMNRGLDGTRLEIRGENGAGSTFIEGERLAKLVQVLDETEESLRILERRGQNLAAFFARAGEGGLPIYRMVLAGREHWFRSEADMEAFREAERQRLGRDLVVADEPQGNGNGHGEAPAPTFFEQELHEVRGINRGLERLREFHLGTADLVPAARVAGREPPPRFVLHNGESRNVLPHLRVLPPEVRRLGEKGLTITRFKGLGEMDGEELWETTLDPAKRTLLQVQLEDAFKADEMFRTLMGEKVEPRREFIQKHALEVKDIDYHGA
jgi:DNA gyrase subunit B